MLHQNSSPPQCCDSCHENDIQIIKSSLADQIHQGLTVYTVMNAIHCLNPQHKSTHLFQVGLVLIIMKYALVSMEASNPINGLYPLQSLHYSMQFPRNEDFKPAAQFSSWKNTSRTEQRARSSSQSLPKLLFRSKVPTCLASRRRCSMDHAWSRLSFPFGLTTGFLQPEML